MKPQLTLTFINCFIPLVPVTGHLLYKILHIAILTWRRNAFEFII